MLDDARVKNTCAVLEIIIEGSLKILQKQMTISSILPLAQSNGRNAN